MAANERAEKFVVWAQIAILAALLFVSWQVRGLHAKAGTPPMKLESEWIDSGGKIERFTSYRIGSEPFVEFRERHAAAVEDLRQ